MHTLANTLAAAAAFVLLAAVAVIAVPAAGASGQSAREVLGPTAYLPLDSQPAPTLTVDAPLPGPLARGAAIIQYRTENFRILPVFGPGALDVSPRVGHLHVTVDNLPWHWADAGDTNTIVVAGLPAGQHSVLIELADAQHQVITAKTVTFTVPATAAHGH